jgi:hypothetical protein
VPKLKWGLKGDPGEIEGRNVYDGPTPPKGVYICALVRLGLRENSSGDNMFNGLLEIRDPRPNKKKYSGYSFWFNRNVTDQGARFVKNFITQGLGVPMKTMADLDKLVIVQDDELPTQVVSIGKVKLDSEPLLVVVARRRRDVDDPELETDDFAPAFPGIDPKKLASAKSEDEDDEELDDDEDEDDDSDPFEDDEDDADEEDDSDDEEDEDEDEDELTREELEAMGLPELRELAVESGAMTSAKAKKAKKTALVEVLAPAEDEDEDEDEDEEEDEEDDEPPTPPKKTTRKTKSRK